MRTAALTTAFCLLVGSAFAQSPTTTQSSTAQSPAGSCEKLASVDIPNATITMAKVVEAGTFAGPPQAFTGADISSLYKALPAFCRVVVHARPSTDSDIVIEVWMPLAGWNGKLRGLGNGGFAGLIDTTELSGAVLKGYAATATDAGHAGSPIASAWARGHPEKVADFGHRGIHEMTRVAKLAVQAFYGSGAKHSYFIGCSDGGREALMEAQRYPEDYDGILAGAPANNWTALLTSAAVDRQALMATPGSFIPPAKVAVIAKAVVAACDAQDGVTDGILNDPRQCRFEPAAIQCKGAADGDDCLTGAQVTALKAIYAGLTDGQGKRVFPGYLPGAEDGKSGWGLWITGPAPGLSVQAAFAHGYFSDMVYERAEWDFKLFVLDESLRDAREKTSAVLDAVNPDLSAFRDKGGKLILYHGWNDPAIPALSTVDYYERVVAKSGEAAADGFVRLYMLPGVQHCVGGPGPDFVSGDWRRTDAQHNTRMALEEWVEKGIAPGTLVATKVEHGATTMQRPVCAYPQTAKYNGRGDPNKAESFACASAGKQGTPTSYHSDGDQ